MVKNYLKIALRNLRQNKSYTFINLAGLAVGMACCILIALYVKEELSFDDFHTKADRIVTVGIDSDFFGRRLSSPYPLADAMVNEIPGVEKAIRYSFAGKLSLSTEGQSPVKITGENEYGRYTEPGFFDIFSFRLIHGNPQKVLSSPNSIVLTESARNQLFDPGQNPLGKTLYWHDRDTIKTLEITGVIQDAPRNSTVQYASLISYNTKPESQRNPDSWSGYSPRTYALLKFPEASENLTSQLDKLVQRKYETPEGEEPATTFFWMPLTEIHLSEVSEDEGFAGNRVYLYLFGSVALFILIIACVNYINLATARTSLRSQEVGVRKTLGALRSQVAGQFLGEAVLFSITSYVIGVGLSLIALPYFNQMFGTSVAWQANIGFLIWLLGAAIGVGLIAGIYPAIYLSKFAPVEVLRNRMQVGPSGSWLRKSLVVIQFALALILIISALVVHKQLLFTQQKDLGFDGEQVAAIMLNNRQRWNLRETIVQNIRTYSGIKAASVVTSVPGEFNVRIGYPPDNISSKNKAPSDEPIMFAPAVVDYQFLDLMDIDLLAGRAFSKELSTDEKRAVIINKKAAYALGWTPKEAIGKTFNIHDDGGKIIGVIENFHIRSLREKVEPVHLQIAKPESWGPRGFILAKLTPDRIASGIEVIKKEFSNYGDTAFEYEFLDEKFDAMYRTEERMAQIVSFFTVIAIFIACLGLYGLSAFSVDRRTKEIGIRKVLGATITNIVGLLSKDFLKLVVLGFIISIPVSWYFMNMWLQDFAYQIEIGAMVFLLAGISALLIALATVSWQSVRAAISNPVDSLRSE